MDVRTAERIATGVGTATLAIGATLLGFTDRASSAAGLHDRRATQAIAIADLALVPGLLLGRPRWPWMAARGALNLVIATRLATAGTVRARVIAGALIGLTVGDTAVAATLRAHDR